MYSKWENACIRPVGKPAFVGIACRFWGGFGGASGKTVAGRQGSGEGVFGTIIVLGTHD